MLIPEIVLDQHCHGRRERHCTLLGGRGQGATLVLPFVGSALAFLVGAIKGLRCKRLTPKSDTVPSILMLKDDVSVCLPFVECMPKAAPVEDRWATRAPETGENPERADQDLKICVQAGPKGGMLA